MTSEFVKRVNAFLDLEAHGSGFAEYALDMAQDYLREEKPGAALTAELHNVRQGEQASLNLLKLKALPDLNVEDLSSKFISSEDHDFSMENKWDSTGNSNYQLTKEMLLQFIAEKQGMSVSEVEESIKREIETQRIQELRSPALHRALLRRYLRELDRMVGQLESLDFLSLDWSRIPPHLQTLVSNAHECSLLGQGVACAVLCGAALEEALRIRLGPDQFKELAAAIRKAVELRLLIDPSPALQAARDIQAERNQAIHQPSRYLSKSLKTNILLNVRYVLTILFEKSE